MKSKPYFYKRQYVIASFGTYAVATKHPSNNSTTTRCCPAILATLPRIPLNSPSVTITISPSLNWMLLEVMGMMCGFLMEVRRMKLFIASSWIVNGGLRSGLSWRWMV